VKILYYYVQEKMNLYTRIWETLVFVYILYNCKKCILML
jgi:hypothetical protein